MKKVLLICLALSLLWVADAGAQAITQGGATGTLVSAEVADIGSVAVIYTTPPKGHFVLTQVGGGNCTFTVEGFGYVGASQGGAQTFTPGFFVPPSTAISAAATNSCYIIGVLEK